jgi:hypothetical protein
MEKTGRQRFREKVLSAVTEIYRSRFFPCVADVELLAGITSFLRMGQPFGGVFSERGRLIVQENKPMLLKAGVAKLLSRKYLFA